MEHWREHFRAKGEPCLPWQTAPLLTAAERELVSRSVPHFQLGEGSEGNGLVERGRCAGDEELASALRAFIGEEQRHSALLGRFLDREGIPRLRKDWVDSVFRRVRGLAGFELCMRVLAVAEIIAVPYYSALRDSTASPLLRELCSEILRDETEHLRFQADCLARFMRGRGMACDLQFLLLFGAAAVVWAQHGGVLRAGGYNVRRFPIECAAELEKLQSRSIRTPAWARPSGC